MKIKLKLTQNQFNQIQFHLFEENNEVVFVHCGSHMSNSSISILGNNSMQPSLNNNFTTKTNGALARFSKKELTVPSSILSTDKMFADVVISNNNKIFSGTLSSNNNSKPISQMMITGDNITIINNSNDTNTPSFLERNQQTFGSGTVNLMNNLSVGVVGCSGTGSIVIEQLVRLGVGELTLIDKDIVEDVNLNRIVNSRQCDIGKAKTKVLENAISEIGFGTKVHTLNDELKSQAAINMIANCDIVFGCMDEVSGRHLLNRISSFYLIPYFDVGVRLDADGKGSINDICGQINYVQPDGSSLLSRGVISREALDAEGLKVTDYNEYLRQKGEKYIIGAQENSPAVISVNMLYASLVVNEFLARLHPYREDTNNYFQYYSFSLGKFYLQNFMETNRSNMIQECCPELRKYIGLGDITPLLDMPILSNRKKAI